MGAMADQVAGAEQAEWRAGREQTAGAGMADREVVEAPYAQGFCPWVLYDYRTERRQTCCRRGWNRKGLMAEDKATRKRAFAVLAGHDARLRSRNM